MPRIEVYRWCYEFGDDSPEFRLHQKIERQITLQQRALIVERESDGWHAVDQLTPTFAPRQCHVVTYADVEYALTEPKTGTPWQLFLHEKAPLEPKERRK